MDRGHPVNSTWRHGARMLRREWHGRELRILCAALVIAVAAISCVGFVAGRVTAALAQQSNLLLGADLLLVSDHPIDPRLLDLAHRLHLQTARTLVFPSMILHGENAHLAVIKAVSPHYPLRGHLRTAAAPHVPDQQTDTIPAPGSVWVEARLLPLLGLHMNDPLTIGNARFRLARILTNEPDRGEQWYSIAPRIMMNIDDIPATGLITPTNRVAYRLLLAGDPHALDAFQQQARPLVGRGQRFESLKNARPELREVLGKGGRYLNLISLSSVILAAIAISLATLSYTRGQMDTVALLRTLGTTQAQILRMYLYQFLVLGLASSLAGCLLGYAAQEGLARLLARLLTLPLPPPAWTPAALGLATGMVTLLAFAVPPLVQLKHTPPLRILRTELGAPRRSSLYLFGSGVLLLAGLLLWQAGEWTFGLLVLAGLVGAALLAYGLARLLLKSLNVLRGQVGVAWRFGLASLARHRFFSALQIVVFGLGLLVLLLLTLVRNDLFADWQATLPPQAPNWFLINIEPDQVQPVQQYLIRQHIPGPHIFMMVRGRLARINNRAVSQYQYHTERARNLVEREFNLSEAGRLAWDNTVSTGHFWSARPQPPVQFSVEEELARTLGIHVGDTLTFTAAGRQLRGPVTSLRHINWNSMQVNFFILAPPGALAGLPASYITSFYLPPGQDDALNGLVKTYPNITAIDVTAIIRQMHTVMDSVATAVEFVFLFTLLAGLTVLYAGIAATHDQRVYEMTILRTLGATRRQLLLSVTAEFVSLGVMAGLIAALSAAALSWVLSVRVFHIAYAFNPVLLLAGIVLGGCGITLAGLTAVGRIIRTPPMKTLRGG